MNVVVIVNCPRSCCCVSSGVSWQCFLVNVYMNHFRHIVSVNLKQIWTEAHYFHSRNLLLLIQIVSFCMMSRLRVCALVTLPHTHVAWILDLLSCYLGNAIFVFSLQMITVPSQSLDSAQRCVSPCRRPSFYHKNGLVRVKLLWYCRRVMWYLFDQISRSHFVVMWISVISLMIQWNTSEQNGRLRLLLRCVLTEICTMGSVICLVIPNQLWDMGEGCMWDGDGGLWHSAPNPNEKQGTKRTGQWD